MLLSPHQNAGQNHGLEIKYLGTTVTKEYFIQEEIKM
jgi:hypothetical protein